MNAKILIGLAIGALLVAGWFLFKEDTTEEAVNTDYVTVIDDEISGLEAELAELEAAIASDTLSPEEAAAAQERIVLGIQSINSAIEESASVGLSDSQSSQLLGGLDRLKGILTNYQGTLIAVDEAVFELPESERPRLNPRGSDGTARRTIASAIEDAVLIITDHIEDVVEEFIAEEETETAEVATTTTEEGEEITIQDVVSQDIVLSPISHATFVLTWDGTVIISDPVGGAEAFEGQPTPDIILITDIHGDHLDAKTLSAIIGEGTVLIVPQAVADELPDELRERSTILVNGEITTVGGFVIEGIPMYNLPENEESRHTKGRGNGYLIERGSARVYIAGDTADIPEMRSLADIDIALVPMNLPYTMDVDTAADAVLDFAPRTVYPYHYRGQDGLSDIERFKELVNAGNPNIEVVLLDWYPDME